MPTIKATDVEKRHPRASDVEIKNLAAKMGADVDWSGWAAPADNVPGHDAPLGDPENNARRERGMAANFSLRGMAKNAANLIPPVLGGLAGGATALATRNLPATMAAEGAGNALGEKARIMAMRGLGLPTPDDEEASIAMQGALGAAGPAVSRVGSMAKNSLYRGAMGAGVKETSDAVKVASRLAGRKVAPDEASIAAQGLADRVPLGPGIGGRGMERLDKLDAPHNDAISEALYRADMSGYTATIDQVVWPAIRKLAAKVSREEGGAQRVDLINEWSRELTDQLGKPTVSGGAVVFSPLTAGEIQSQKRIWQDQAESVYKSKAADPNQKLRAKFDAAIAAGAREHLEGLNLPSHLPRRTVGDVLKQANAALSARKPLREATSRREIAMAAGKASGGSLVGRALAPTAGGAFGFATGMGGQGAAGGALAGMALERAISNHGNASRLAIGMDYAPVRATGQVLSRAPAALFPWLNKGNDRTAPGGYLDPNQ